MKSGLVCGCESSKASGESQFLGRSKGRGQLEVGKGAYPGVPWIFLRVLALKCKVSVEEEQAGRSDKKR